MRSHSYGYITGGYFIGYGIIRGILEPLRSSDYNLPFFGKDTNVPAMTIISIILVIGGILLILDTLRRDGKIKIRFIEKLTAKRKAAETVNTETEKAETVKAEAENAEQAEKRNSADKQTTETVKEAESDDTANKINKKGEQQ